MLDAGYWKEGDLHYFSCLMYYLSWFFGLMKKIMSYKSLEIWKLANELAIEIHTMTLNCLPKFEMYETGSQIRRSSKSVKSNIVEGYGRRRYKQDFLHFLITAISSNDETIDHLETLYHTKSLRDEQQFKDLFGRLNELGKRMNRFIRSVEKHHIPAQKY